MTGTVANRLTLFLLLVCLGLGVLLARELRAVGAASQARPGTLQDDSQDERTRANPLPTVPPAPGVQTYQEILARPLFIRSRQPPAKPQPAPVREQAKPLHYLLEGVALSRDTRVALLLDPRSRERVSLEEGHVWEGWVVEQVLADRVILSAEGELQELLLEPPDENAPAQDRGAAGTSQKP